MKLSADGDNSLGIIGDEWDQHPMWLPCVNGIIDLKTSELFEGKPEHYMRTICPMEWQGLDCRAHRWEQFLREIFNEDQELTNYLQRLLGYSLTGKTTEHIYPIAWGDGRNGKGTLFETLQFVLGDFAGPVEPEMVLQQSYARKSGSASSDIMFLRGKRLVWASEVSEGRRLDTGKLKWLTGGDTLTGRVPYGKRQVSFRPTHKLFLLTNHKPHAPASDFALWQRIHLIPFTQAFVTEPKVASGILAWLVRGCLEWQKQGLKPAEVVKTATEEYRKDEDIISHFISDRCSLGGHTQAKAGELYSAYSEWCKDMGHRAMSGTRFGREMGKRFDSHSDSRGKYYLGIEINNPSS
jgi:putative DNA primase/helicase